MGKSGNSKPYDQLVPTLTPRNSNEAFRDVRNFLAGQFVGVTGDDALLDQVLVCLFCKLLIEKGEAQPLTASHDSFAQAKRQGSIFSRVRSQFPDIYAADSGILLDPAGSCSAEWCKNALRS
jgi:type I restriction enzyme M protein